MNNLYNKIYNAVNEGIKKALLDPEQNDVSINYAYKKIDNRFDIYDFLINGLITGNDIEYNYNAVLDYYYERNKKYTATDKNVLKRIIVNCTKVDNKCDLKWINVSELTDISFLFSIKDQKKGSPEKTQKKIMSKFNGDVSNWDVRNIKDMSYLFYKTSFNGDLSQWQTENLENMSYMFYDTPFNNNSIANWHVDKVKNMSHLFESTVFNGDLSNWHVDNVTNMNSMFQKSYFNNDSLAGWHTGNVQIMYSMFAYSHFNGNIADWNVLKVKDAGCMFFNSEFDNDIYKWFSYDKGKNELLNISSMFQGSIFNQDISEWNVENVKNAMSLFSHSKFNRDISNWKFKNLENGSFMFCDAEFNQDISSWKLPQNILTSNYFLHHANIDFENQPKLRR